MNFQLPDHDKVANAALFKRWVEAAGFAGSRNHASRALGVTTETIRTFEEGAALKRSVRLAMAAVIAGMKPYGE